MLARRLMLEGLATAHAAGRLAFFGDLARLKDGGAFGACLAPLRRKNWFVYAKPPFAGPKAVLAYLSRYTHRVAIGLAKDAAIIDVGLELALAPNTTLDLAYGGQFGDGTQDYSARATLALRF